MNIILSNGDYKIKAGEIFFFKGHECMLVATEEAEFGHKTLDAVDTIKIDGKYYSRSRRTWIEKFNG